MASEELRAADTTKPSFRQASPNIVIEINTNSRDSERLTEQQVYQE
jgi:hypothetical protein